MRIIFDLQINQASYLCGNKISRFAIELVKACIRNSQEHEILIALSNLYPNTVEFIRAEFFGLLPQENIHIWNAIGPVNMNDPHNESRRKTAELLRESFLASLDPDIVHICNLFEEGEIVSSVGCLTQTIPTSITLYDLKLYLYPELYLKNSSIERWYENKLDHFRRANLYLTVSESSRQEAINFGISAEDIVNISFASNHSLQPISISLEEEYKLRENYQLLRPFIMCINDGDHKKNITGLIRSYAMLPKPIRLQHQLAIVCDSSSKNSHQLQRFVFEQNLVDDEVVFVILKSENDLFILYNLCKLFVCPSFYEGFGLEILQAMQSGAAVISSNIPSLSEVIEDKDALFDPFSDESITTKIQEALTKEVFRKQLITQGLKQAKNFSWDICAKKAIAAFENFSIKHQQRQVSRETNRPRLAFVSPMPPVNSGVADYSAELLPELSKYYEIDLILSQSEEPTTTWVKANCNVRSPEWLRSNVKQIDRIIYHFGNNLACHGHMFALLRDIPGIVVLHEFFLNDIQYGRGQRIWFKELYHSHGYPAISEYLSSDPKERPKQISKFPVNLSILQQAQGVIVHSEYCCQLARDWYGIKSFENWSVIPHARKLVSRFDRKKARAELGLNDTDFIICSFGYLTPPKLADKLLQAWQNSVFSKENNCKLIFVGKDPVLFGENLIKKIENNNITNRIHITGWVDATTYHYYLAAADIAVQLRSDSRGETSGTVHDCMNYGIATIVNGHAAFAELPENALWMLPDQFSVHQLQHALETLWQNKVLRKKIGYAARQEIKKYHPPHICAEQYKNFIELIYYKTRAGSKNLIKTLTKFKQLNKHECIELAQLISRNTPPKPIVHKLFIDISATCRADLKTGIQRIARALLLAILASPPAGFRVEPVYLSNEDGVWCYRYARRYTMTLLNCSYDDLSDSIVDMNNGDILLDVDFAGSLPINAEKSGLHATLKNMGIKIYFMVPDLLPVKYPEFFLPDTKEVHINWLQAVTKYDGAICISKTVADELAEWIKKTGLKNLRPFKIGWFHLGADLENSAASYELNREAKNLIKQIKICPTFLMVGTIEPRKGHLQTLEAFTNLWSSGYEINLVIVGKKGWDGVDNNSTTRTIDRLNNHPKKNHHLFWLEAISDEYLQNIYTHSSCLIAASEDEGFGLSLIEAAKHKLPLIVRDIPIFREVAGENASYFEGNNPSDLANTIKKWLLDFEKQEHRKSDAMPWLTWEQSAQRLLDIILNENWYQTWIPNWILSNESNTLCLTTQIGEFKEKQIIALEDKAGYLIQLHTKLCAGNHYLVMGGNLKTDTFENVKIDVIVNKKEKILFDCANTISSNTFLIKLSFVLLENSENVEINFWVDKNSSLSISFLKMEPYENYNVFKKNHILFQVNNLLNNIKNVFLSKAVPPRIFLDISATSSTDLKTGIERVARALVLSLLKLNEKKYNVEPVYLSNKDGVWHYKYARQYTSKLLGKNSEESLNDDNADICQSDILIGMDLATSLVVAAEKDGFYDRLRAIGANIYFIVYDLLPITKPEFFPPDAEKFHSEWLSAITKNDGAICISQTVAHELKKWLKESDPKRLLYFKIGWFHLGADLENSAASYGLPTEAESLIRQLKSYPTFLMVGTIEPRKGHLQVLKAFTNLWASGYKINLVIVGKEGWLTFPQNMRRTIPEIVDRLSNHPERNHHLFWLETTSDEYLQIIYKHSSCLIAASEDEGFGIPLIEAAKYRLPLIVKDIPIFQEVAGEYASYFVGNNPSDLADTIKKWLLDFEKDEHRKSDAMPWLTWEQSAQKLLDIILANTWWYSASVPEDIFRSHEKLSLDYAD